jgi:hypothetical protein
VLIAAANKLHISALRPQITYINISGKVAACQVADVHRPVRIRKGSSYQVSFEIHNVYGDFAPGSFYPDFQKYVNKGICLN